MLDKVEYWLELCDDDLKAARAMLGSKNLLWAGFICHLIAEKALKAAIANITNEAPPKTHDLPKLASKTNLYGDMSENHKILLNKLTPLQIEARYPEYKEKITALLTEEYCGKLLKETEELLCWIKTKLEK
ncbi:MAG: HEPN domain-containing protein [Oscillospiraceae bacterium]|nr:HEPN domain-containing protein [Oscillospiraceae bacterium]